MHRATLPLTAVWLLVHFADLPAQNPPPLEPGARVSISAPDHGVRRLVGTFSGYDSESIGIKPDDKQNSVWVPLTSVTRLQQVVGRKYNIVKGAWIGSLVGGTVGAVVGLIISHYEDEPGVSYPGTPPAAVMCGGIGALLGAPIGGFIGAFVTSNRWEEVPLDRMRVSFAPRRDGFALGLSVSF